MRNTLYKTPAGVFSSWTNIYPSLRDENDVYEVQSKSNAYIFIVTVQELLLQPR